MFSHLNDQVYISYNSYSTCKLEVMTLNWNMLKIELIFLGIPSLLLYSLVTDGVNIYLIAKTKRQAGVLTSYVCLTQQPIKAYCFLLLNYLSICPFSIHNCHSLQCRLNCHPHSNSFGEVLNPCLPENMIML